MDIMPRRRTTQPWIWLSATAALLALAWMLTYLAGGTRTPVPHVFYVPIVIASGMFGVRAGLGAALAAGTLCGPLMPLDVALGQPQTTLGWLVRLGFFLLIALVVGVGGNRLIELVNARQDFLSAVSHELRTPLASVVGFASVLVDRSEELTDEEQQEFAALILRESTELSNVVDHYVLEGRLSDSALFIEALPTDLRRIVDVVLEGLPAEIRERRIEVHGTQVMCVADPLRLRQVFRSVLNNALAYTPAPIEVAITTEKHQARVTVSEREAAPDNRLWSPRISSTTPGLVVSPPLGVGLSVSRDLVHLMGGHLQYQVNGRINYDIRLPLHRV